MAQDYSRAMTASLFSGNPRQSRTRCFAAPPPHLLTDPHPPVHTHAAQQSLISYVKTFEEQPGSPQLKARFLILAGTSPLLGPSLSPALTHHPPLTRSPTRRLVQDPQGETEPERLILDRENLGTPGSAKSPGRKSKHTPPHTESKGPILTNSLPSNSE